MLGIDDHRFRSVRFFKITETNTRQRIEPWMTTIVDLDTGQILGVVDGRDHTGVGAWLIKRPLEWRLGEQERSYRSLSSIPQGTADVAAPHRRLC